MRVLNTRPRDQAAELSRLLRAAGFDVVEAPAIAIEPAWRPAELAAARRDLASEAFTWIVLPSHNSGHALVSDLRGMSERVLCGSATAEALGLSRATTLDRFSAAAALEFLASRVHSGMRLLVPRAAEGRDELVEGLRSLGADVSAPVAYRTVPDSPASEKLHAGGIDVVALCSPSAAASVAPAIAPHLRVVCLGGTTAEAARALHVRVDAVARQTSMPSLVQAVESLTDVRV